MKLMIREASAPTLALFASASTLLCCALPALLITIGAGAVMAGLTANIPGFIWLTAHKAELFIVSGILLIIASYMKWHMRNAPCPIDPALARTCTFWRKAGTIILGVAITFYLIGGFFAFFADELFF